MIWQDSQGNLHDDMDGQALSLFSWPKGMTLLTDEQVAAIRQAEQQAQEQLQQETQAQAAAVAAAKVSAISKLAALGLTETEVAALIGQQQ